MIAHTPAIPCSRILILAVAVWALSNVFAPPARGDLINDSHIYYQHRPPDMSFFIQTASTFFDATYTPVPSNPSLFMSPFAEITSGAIRMGFQAQTPSGSFPELHASVRDFYMLDGAGIDLDPGQPGTQVSLPVTLTVEGEVDRTFFPPLGEPFGGLILDALIGHDINFAGSGVTGGSPVIAGGFASTSVFEIPLGGGAAHADINTTVQTDLLVTLGQQFQLAFEVALKPTFGIDADLTNTITVGFDVDPGMTLSSTNGFGAAVPEPSTCMMFVIGLTLLLAYRRVA